MKALMAIDDAMKAALVKIHGVAEEDDACVSGMLWAALGSVRVT